MTQGRKFILENNRIKKNLSLARMVEFSSRKTGRTNALINAVKSLGLNAVVVVHNHSFARELKEKHPEVNFISSENAENLLMGRHSPVSSLLEESGAEVGRLIKYIKENNNDTR
jgi:quinolinate synthase